MNAATVVAIVAMLLIGLVAGAFGGVHVAMLMMERLAHRVPNNIPGQAIALDRVRAAATAPNATLLTVLDFIEHEAHRVTQLAQEAGTDLGRDLTGGN